MQMKQDTAVALRQALKGRILDGYPMTGSVSGPGSAAVSLGVQTIDQALGGGLARGALHELYAAAHADTVAATGFALALAAMASKDRPTLIVRQDVIDTETGCLNTAGLSEMGLDPHRIILVRARDIAGGLNAGEQAARCVGLGAVVIAFWGESKLLDLKASRRLSLAAGKSGVPVIMVRAAAAPSQSAATTRWRVRASPSRALAANAPGLPAFELDLLRLRGGMAGHLWSVEWDRAHKRLQHRPSQSTPLPRSVVSFSRDGSPASPAQHPAFRRTG